SDLLVRVWIAETLQGSHARLELPFVDAPLRQPRIVRHVRIRRELSGRNQMSAMPRVRVLAANARQIRPGAFGTPLKRPIVCGFLRGGMRAVALRLETQRADHL